MVSEWVAPAVVPAAGLSQMRRNVAAEVRVRLPVLFEDDALLVVDKPAGIAVHGGSGVSFGVIEALRRQRPQAKFLELAHRLDRETSGILLIGKKRSALNRLHDMFREGGREADKRYLVLVKRLIDEMYAENPVWLEADNIVPRRGA